MKTVCIVVLSAVLVLGSLPFAVADSEYIGVIKSVKPIVSVIRQGSVVPAAANMKLMAKDELRTGTDGAVGIVLNDDTVLSLGPDSDIVIEDFAFDPAAEKLSFIVRMLQGTADYLSGQIEKLSPASIQFRTPVATIGARGTHFLLKVERD
jgi:hypothetical protein